MTKLFLIRHGQSTANVDAVFAGHTNAPLSPLGRQQAEATARFLTARCTVDAVYASDLDRAYDTGKAAADAAGLPVIPDPRLREIYAGTWEGQSFAFLIESGNPDYLLWRTDIGSARCTQGESPAELQARVLEALEEICLQNPGKTVVIATHATPVRVFMTHCLGKSVAEMQSVPWVSNASVTEAAYENGVFTLISPGMDEHLGALRTVLPKKV